MCVLVFSTTFTSNIPIRKIIKRNIVINAKSLHVKYPLFLSDFNDTWAFYMDFRKKKKLK
jgi:hypothetical protein